MPHTWPSSLRNRTFCWPRFEMRAPLAATRRGHGARMEHRTPIWSLHQVLESWHAGVQTPFRTIDPTHFLPPAQAGRPHRRVPLDPSRVRGSVCGTTIVGHWQNCKPGCRTLWRYEQSPNIIDSQAKASNQATTHRQLSLRSAEQCPPSHPLHWFQHGTRLFPGPFDDHGPPQW